MAEHRIALYRDRKRTVLTIVAPTQADAVAALGDYLHEHTFVAGAGTSAETVMLAILRDGVARAKSRFDDAIAALQAEEEAQLLSRQEAAAAQEEGPGAVAEE